MIISFISGMLSLNLFDLFISFALHSYFQSLLSLRILNLFILYFVSDNCIISFFLYLTLVPAFTDSYSGLFCGVYLL